MMRDHDPFGTHHQAEMARTVRNALVLDRADSFDRAEGAGLHSGVFNHHGHSH